MKSVESERVMPVPVKVAGRFPILFRVAAIAAEVPPNKVDVGASADAWRLTTKKLYWLDPLG
jgi:hypothetical protein